MNSPTTHALHRPCRVVADHSRSQPEPVELVPGPVTPEFAGSSPVAPVKSCVGQAQARAAYSAWCDRCIRDADDRALIGPHTRDRLPPRLLAPYSGFVSYVKIVEGRAANRVAC